MLTKFTIKTATVSVKLPRAKIFPSNTHLQQALKVLEWTKNNLMPGFANTENVWMCITARDERI